jgi:hypothetical protein
MHARHECARALLQAPSEQVVAHRLLGGGEQVVQVARGDAAGLRDAGRREERIVQVRLDVVDDADTLGGGHRGTFALRTRHVDIAGTRRSRIAAVTRPPASASRSW